MRTLQRWHELYKAGGIDSLRPRRPADSGTRRTAQELVAFVERLALTRPRPSVATLHRLAAAEADRLGAVLPSYATVRTIVRGLNPALVTLALDGPTAYRGRHELVL